MIATAKVRGARRAWGGIRARIVIRALFLQVTNIHLSFFETGGDSVLAIMVTAKCAEKGLHLKVADMFQHPSVAQLATFLTKSGGFAAVEPPLEGPVALSPIQHWYWTHARPTVPYNMAVTLRATDLSVDALRKAWEALWVRHDMLRAVYAEEEGALAQTVRSSKDSAVPLEMLPDVDDRDEVRRCASCGRGVGGSIAASHRPARGRYPRRLWAE